MDELAELVVALPDAAPVASRIVRWAVQVGDEVEKGTVLARCSLPRVSPPLSGSAAEPGVEVKAHHKGTVQRLLIAEGERIADDRRPPHPPRPPAPLSAAAPRSAG